VRPGVGAERGTERCGLASSELAQVAEQRATLRDLIEAGNLWPVTAERQPTGLDHGRRQRSRTTCVTLLGFI